MYVFEICAEGIFVTFPWWLENAKSRSKIALFLNERHFEIWFPKKRTITFFWSKLSKLHKKDSILHVATIFFLKQGETKNKPWTHSTPVKTSIWVELRGICSHELKSLTYSQSAMWYICCRSLSKILLVSLYCMNLKNIVKCK